MAIIGPVLIGGKPCDPAAAAVPVTDIAVLRGYGCFETVRSYGGIPFRLEQHLDRLAGSAARLGIPLPPVEDLAAWVADRAAEGDCAVRLVVTGGFDADAPGTGSSVIVFAEPLPSLPAAVRVLPLEAPWLADGAWSTLTGAKTLSYAAHVAARLEARRAGFDDALLIGRTGSVLEGPNTGVAWVRDGRLAYPDPSLGVLASITSSAVVELAPSVGLEPAPGRYLLDHVLDAEEVMWLSTTREVMPVAVVADRSYAPGPHTAALAEAFAALVAAETGVAAR